MTVIRFISVAGVCLGLTVFLLLAASAYVVRRVDQELTDEAASAPHVSGPRVSPGPGSVSGPTVRATGAEWAVPPSTSFPLTSKASA